MNDKTVTRVERGERACQANHLTHFILGLNYIEGDRVKATYVAGKDYGLLETIANALFDTPSRYYRAEIINPMGELCHERERAK